MSTSNVTEATIEKKIKDWVEAQGGKCIKFTPRGECGWPDRICIFQGGMLVWLELKRPGEEPEPLQYYRMSQLRERGQHVMWSDNYRHCTERLQEFMNGDTL